MQLDAETIQRYLPHRAPMLFLRAADIDEDGSARAVACWPADSPLVQGHFPGNPVVPGVCQIEALAQLAGLAILQSPATRDAVASGGLGVLASVRSARFRGLLRPGETLLLQARIRPIQPRLYVATGSGRRDSGAVLFEGEVAIGLALDGELQ